jgi:glycosyltransferase involved in cell wall biosynthesis
MEFSNSSIPNLTVVIPTFKRLELLKKLLHTIPKDIKVIVSDNGSHVPQEFMDQFPTFEFFQTGRQLDSSENWNNCINLVQTEWFMLPSDDDLYYPDSFGIIERELLRNVGSDLIIFGHYVINELDEIKSTWLPGEKTTIQPPHSYEIFKYGVEARFPGLIFKKSIAVENGCIDNSYKLTASDSKLIQLCMLNGVVSFIPEVVGGYRVWAKNSTTLTLGTLAWLNEIDRWQDEILLEVKKKFSANGKQPNYNNIKDEVYARNLIGGILNNRKSHGLRKSVEFFWASRYPINANFRTQLRMIKALFIG